MIVMYFTTCQRHDIVETVIKYQHSGGRHGRDGMVPMQSVPITTEVVSLNPMRRGVLDATLCDKVCK